MVKITLGHVTFYKLPTLRKIKLAVKHIFITTLYLAAINVFLYYFYLKTILLGYLEQSTPNSLITEMIKENEKS